MPRALAVHVLFGRSGQLFGFVILIFAFAAVALFARSSEPPIGPSYDRAAPGTVVRVADSGTKSGEATVYAVDATFTDERGEPRRVRSYTNTKVGGGNINVRYQSSNPDRAVIDGMRTHEDVWWIALIPLLFVVAGFGCIFRGFPASLRALRLLRIGHVASAKTLEVKEERDGQERDGQVMAWIGTFEFTTVDGRAQRCEARTDFRGRFVEGASEIVIYDAGWPDHAEPLRHLPGNPTVSDDRTVTSGVRRGKLRAELGLMVAAMVTAIGATTFTLVSWM